MIINIPSKEKTYTLANDTVFDRDIMKYSESANTIDRRFGSPAAIYKPHDCAYFNSFDVVISGGRSPVEGAVILQVIINDPSLADISSYISSAYTSHVSISVRNKVPPTLGNLVFELKRIKKIFTAPNGISPKNPHHIDLDFEYISGVYIPAGTTIMFSGYNMANETRRIEIVDSSEEFIKPSKLMTPANKAKFGSFSKKVAFDLTLDQINGMEVV